MFKDKAEIRVRMFLDDLSDEELLIKLRDETEALLIERCAFAAENGND